MVGRAATSSIFGLIVFAIAYLALEDLRSMLAGQLLEIIWSIRNDLYVPDWWPDYGSPVARLITLTLIVLALAIGSRAWWWGQGRIDAWTRSSLRSNLPSRNPSCIAWAVSAATVFWLYTYMYSPIERTLCPEQSIPYACIWITSAVSALIGSLILAMGAIQWAGFARDQSTFWRHIARRHIAQCHVAQWLGAAVGFGLPLGLLGLVAAYVAAYFAGFG